MRYVADVPHKWEPWYAWHPVLVDGDSLFWLELVWRRKRHKGGWNYSTLRSSIQAQVAEASVPVYVGV
ncbi:hypothetical protein ASD54_21600 [Rhizobium sp. Root149]|nr:hypothetical protein ASD54_21600 [Rhizobium sp. Root149]